MIVFGDKYDLLVVKEITDMKYVFAHVFPFKTVQKRSLWVKTIRYDGVPSSIKGRLSYHHLFSKHFHYQHLELIHGFISLFRFYSHDECGQISFVVCIIFLSSNL